jgi:hypothetical protein
VNSFTEALEHPSCPTIRSVKVVPNGTATQEPAVLSPRIFGLI